MSLKITVKGVDKLKRRMKNMRKAQSIDVNITTKNTRGFVNRKGGSVDMSRSAKSNREVLARQEREGRRFAYLTKSESKKSIKPWRRGVRKFIRRLVGGMRDIIKESDNAGKLIIKFSQMHIDKSVNIKPVSPGWQKQKDREVGPGKPPLVYTGQLRDSLVYEIKRRG